MWSTKSIITVRLQLKQPYLRIWAWHTGILSPFDKSLTNHLEKRHTKKELRIEKKIKRPHTKEKCQINQTIIEKSLSVNIGLKCVELNQKSKKEKYTLKTNQGYTVGLKKITLCTELHESIREHYRIPNGRPAYLGLYNGKAIEMSWSLNELYQSQKKEKKARNCTSTTLNLMLILNGGD